MHAAAQSFQALLGKLGKAAALPELSWAPQDPLLQADLWGQVFMNLVQGYNIYFGSDPDHPDFAPLYNNLLRLQPNPDDTYVRASLDDGGTYLLSGNRGDCLLATLTLGNRVIGTTETP